MSLASSGSRREASVADQVGERRTEGLGRGVRSSCEPVKEFSPAVRKASVGSDSHLKGIVAPCGWGAGGGVLGGRG